MLEHLGGLWGTHLLADLETLELLNKMAGGVRRHKNEDFTVEETFERRTAPRKAWLDLIARRKERRSLPEKLLEDFTRRNIIRLGIETDCPNCRATNWSTLSDADYKLVCERCLKSYEFPQAELERLQPQLDVPRGWTFLDARLWACELPCEFPDSCSTSTPTSSPLTRRCRLQS